MATILVVLGVGVDGKTTR